MRHLNLGDLVCYGYHDEQHFGYVIGVNDNTAHVLLWFGTIIHVQKYTWLDEMRTSSSWDNVHVIASWENGKMFT